MKHPSQEPNVVPAGFITTVLGSVIAVIVLSCVIMRGIETWRTSDLHGNTSGPAEQMQGVPREVNAMETLPFSIEAQGIADNELAEGVLASYGWVDRAHGIVRVPIDVAVDLYLAGPRHDGPVAAARRPE
ncbi:MAG: hypothetical protein ACM31C_05915 [Acidobacteriota bacterium]